MNHVTNEWEIAASVAALLLSSWAFGTIATCMINIWVMRITSAIYKKDCSWEYNYVKNAVFFALFLVTLVVFVKLMLCPFQWYSV